MTIIIGVVVAGVVVTGILDKDITSVGAIILTLLIALGVAELKEIKTNTNGASLAKDEHITRLNEELAQYRLRDAEIIANALSAQVRAQESQARIQEAHAVEVQQPQQVTWNLNQAPVKEPDARNP